MNIVMLPQRSGKNIICSNVSELKLLNETLHKENIAKEREIRQLNKDAQAYEQTIMNLRKEMSSCKYHTPEVSKKDAEVMAGMCCTGSECGEWEPVKDFSELLRHETLKYQERIQKMESNLKTSSENIRELRRVNVSLSEEMQAMRRLCAALDEQCRDANMRALFKDDIIKEMRRQLKLAKAKVSCDIRIAYLIKDNSEVTSLKSKDFVSGDGECPHGSSESHESAPPACARAQPRRRRDVPPRPHDCRATPSHASGNDESPNIA
ncbi:hypothetical protein HW555_011871 [Spodoptera exigua]|uniref:Uncharacterized protein n=1 Tax=Spodoptera exigua TaxID=7107 RepID=A0A835G8K8_SPOEX|nr:hypothetical protein HW555_011871 [Spodoptera exigua]